MLGDFIIMRLRLLPCAVSVLLWAFVATMQAAPGDLDPSFSGGVTNYPVVIALAVQPDGKIVIGGNFTLADGWSQYRIARLNSDGSLDTGFDAGYVDNYVNCIQLTTNGSIFIGGGFLQVGGATRYHIAMINSNGMVNTAFNPGKAVNNDVYSIVDQSDGKVVIGGIFSSIGKTNISGIARLNANGSLDTNFNVGSGVYGTVYCVTLQADSKVLIGGNFSFVNGVAHQYIARLNADGTLDNSFNPNIPGGGASDGVYTMVLQPDGKVVVGGLFNATVNGTNCYNIVRLNTDGSFDTGFDLGPGINFLGSGTDGKINSMALQADRKLIIAGSFGDVGNAYQRYIARLNTDGSLDRSFKEITVSPYIVSLQADNKVVVGGSFDTFNGIPHNGVARLFGDFPPKFNSISKNVDGSFQVTGWAATNANLEIDGTTNFVNWITLATFFNTNGIFRFDDQQGINFSKRFYRVRWLP